MISLPLSGGQSDDDDDNRYITGCIEVCDDVDGCNKVQRQVINEYLLSSLLIIGIFLC